MNITEDRMFLQAVSPKSIKNAFGESAGLWHMAIKWEPYWLTLVWIDFTLGAFVFLITWRIARRFGGRGLAVVLLIAAVLGPVRDYRFMATFSQWGAYAPGLAPMLAVSGTYVILGITGHGLMRLIGGPAGRGVATHRSHAVESLRSAP